MAITWKKLAYADGTTFTNVNIDSGTIAGVTADAHFNFGVLDANLSYAARFAPGSSYSKYYRLENYQDHLEIYSEDAAAYIFKIDSIGVVTLSHDLYSGGDGTGHDVHFYSDTAGDHMEWIATTRCLTITGTNGTTALNVADGNVTINGTTTLDTGLTGILRGDSGVVSVDSNAVRNTGTPVDDDFAKFTNANTIEGRSYAEIKADLSLENSDINTLITATKLDDLTAPDDNTDLDFSTSLHGLVPKGTNVGHYLKDDGSWAAGVGGGDVSVSGTPVDNQIAIWTDATTIEGVAGLTFDPSTNSRLYITDADSDSTVYLGFSSDDQAGIRGTWAKFHIYPNWWVNPTGNRSFFSIVNTISQTSGANDYRIQGVYNSLFVSANTQNWTGGGKSGLQAMCSKVVFEDTCTGGTIDGATAFAAYHQVLGAVTVTELFNFYSGESSLSGGGSIGTFYGFYCASSMTQGNTNWAIYTDGSNKSYFGGDVIFDGIPTLKETTTPSALANYGKIYTKNDNKLYFQDGAGSEHELAYG